jgi:hypothetical protein
MLRKKSETRGTAVIELKYEATNAKMMAKSGTILNSKI